MPYCWERLTEGPLAGALTEEGLLLEVLLYAGRIADVRLAEDAFLRLEKVRAPESRRAVASAARLNIAALSGVRVRCLRLSCWTAASSCSTWRRCCRRTACRDST